MFGEGASGLPTENLIFKMLEGSMVDSIGLSVADYDNVDSTVRDIFFEDSSTIRDIADAYALAIASPYLNLGTMVGNNTQVALYSAETSRTTLDNALSFLGSQWFAAGSASRDAVHVSTWVGSSLLEILGIDLSQFVGSKIAITSNGETSIGYIGVAGGEALKANLFSSLDLTSWTPASTTIIDADSFSVDANWGSLSKSSQLEVRKLYKISYEATASIGKTHVRDTGDADTSVYSAIFDAYRNCTSSTIRIVSSSTGATVDVITLSYQEVTDVANTGAKVYNSKELTTQRWAIEGVTNYNNSDGITFVVYP
jgi:hypothetical protein